MPDFEAMTETEEKNFHRFEYFRDQQLVMMLGLLKAKATVTLVDSLTNYSYGSDRNTILLYAQLMHSKADALEVQPELIGAMKYAGYQMLLGLTRINLSSKE